MEERRKELSKVSSQLLGKKGAFYSPFPKTSRWGLFRPETPVLAGQTGQTPEGWIIGAGPEIPVQRAGDSSLAGDSGHSPGVFRTPIQYHTTKMQMS